MDTAEAIISGLGIVGTLAGVIFGYRGALRSVEMEQEHLDRTRFQEHRLNAYSEFQGAVSDLRAIKNVEGVPTDLQADAFQRFNNTYGKIDLLSGRDLDHAMRVMHLYVSVFMRRDAVDDEFMSGFTQAQTDVERAMRKELGLFGVDEVPTEAQNAEYRELMKKLNGTAETPNR